MSLQFSNPTLKSGICELIDKRIGTSTASYPVSDKVSDINLSLSEFNLLALQSSGKWQFDDSNQLDYPIITCDLNANQRDYSFLLDGSGNLILDIYKVMIANPAGVYYDLLPTDMQSDRFDQSFYDGLNIQGSPIKYDKTANGIFLNVVPNYTITGGIKIFFNRETTFFVSTDTTKMPGFAGTLHEYLVVKTAYRYAASNSLPQAGGRLRNGSYTGLALEVNDWEQKIQDYYGQRAKDEQPILQSKSTKTQGWR